METYGMITKQFNQNINQRTVLKIIETKRFWLSPSSEFQDTLD